MDNIPYSIIFSIEARILWGSTHIIGHWIIINGHGQAQAMDGIKIPATTIMEATTHIMQTLPRGHILHRMPDWMRRWRIKAIAERFFLPWNTLTRQTIFQCYYPWTHHPTITPWAKSMQSTFDTQQRLRDRLPLPQEPDTEPFGTPFYGVHIHPGTIGAGPGGITGTVHPAYKPGHDTRQRIRYTEHHPHAGIYSTILPIPLPHPITIGAYIPTPRSGVRGLCLIHGDTQRILMDILEISHDNIVDALQHTRPAWFDTHHAYMQWNRTMTDTSVHEYATRTLAYLHRLNTSIQVWNDTYPDTSSRHSNAIRP